ncbi:MAG: hypothetical protein GXP30_06320 [Verrucomicrobia bacterium]|nr:hypothetical protein [Verrucomicrobiota bacterium]
MKHDHTANTDLKERIFQKIEASSQGAVSFAKFMELALYEPQLGYYSQPGRPIGRESGDFYTSVSVGKCFGLLLGYAIEAEWEQAGRPADWLIAEQGAHDGQLALDIIEGLQQRKCPLLESLRYVVIESHEGRRDFLKNRLDRSPMASVVSAPDEIQTGTGIFLCNELVDAFPVHRIRWTNEKWQELFVTRAETASCFALQARDTDNPELLTEASRLNTEDFPEGYTTEINLAMKDWMKSVGDLFENGKGCWWVIDYGHREEEYYSPTRREGTLRCYREHRASDDALVGLGETDITAHVNFSRLADYAAETGLTDAPLQDQHDFLIRAAKPWLLAMEASADTQNAGNKKLLRQFQTLTHPGMMGRAFKVLTLRN